MSPSDYKSNGFLLSTLLDQTIINRAESDVIVNYIQPICPDLNPLSPLYKKAVMTLAFYLMCKRNNIFMTRSGAKTKDNQFSEPDQEGWKTVNNLALDCHYVLEELKNQEGAIENPKINDIANIYFKSTYWAV